MTVKRSLLIPALMICFFPTSLGRFPQHMLPPLSSQHRHPPDSTSGWGPVWERGPLGCSWRKLEVGVVFLDWGMFSVFGYSFGPAGTTEGTVMSTSKKLLG